MAVHPESHISLFSGIGALDLAVSRVFPAARTLLYCEREAYACAVLAARMEDGSLDAAPIWSDITTLPTGSYRGQIDLVYGGSPCQDLSLAGKRAGIGGERSGLFFDLIRVVRDVRPRYVFLENVAAIATGRALDAVLGALAEIGFDAEWGCLRASDVGAPHRRDRWWCLAWDRELLGHPERQGLALGRRVGRHDGQEHQAAQRAGDPLADPARLQRPGQGWGLRDGGRVREVRQVVGDPERDGGERWRGAGDLAGSSATPQREAHQRERRGCAAGDPGSGMADTGRGPGELANGHATLGGRPNNAEQTGVGSSGLGWPGFPPGPDDRDGWQRFLEQYPNLAPATERAVRRATDGPAVRVDRLRALGNAVVPQQAAAALRILWYRAFGEYP